MARYRPDAFSDCRPWQDCAPMRSRRGLGRGKHRFAATYRRHVFRYSLFWQDMRAMCPKSPAERRWGMHRANILPSRGAFAVRSPQIMHGARILPPSDGLAPEHGLLPEQLHRGIVLQRLGPCPGGGCLPPSASPIPATRCTPPLLFKLNQTRPVGLGGPFRRKGTEHVKELRYGRGSLGSATSSGLPSRVASCPRLAA